MTDPARESQSMVPRLDAEARHWALLAVGALAIAGGFALMLAGSRTPGLQEHLPVHFFYTALVIHVGFSFVVWFLAVLGVMVSWTMARIIEKTEGFGQGRAAWLGAVGLRGALVAVVLMLLPALLNWGVPLQNNYVPVIDHPVFLAGVVLLLVSVGLPVLRLLLNVPRTVGPVGHAVAMAGVTYGLALVCFLLAWLELPDEASPETRYEVLFWGGGHVLQFANTILMLVVWRMTAQVLHGVSILPGRSFAIIVGLIVLAALPGPVLYVLYDAQDALLTTGFSWMYRGGLLVQPVLAVSALAWLMVRRGLRLGDVAGSGLFLSAVLFALGGLAGYTAGYNDTRTPAHYHAVLGAVTLAFMTWFAVVLLPHLGRPINRPRLTQAFIWMYGVGQLIHSSGLFVAGVRGISRKTAGAAQELHGLVEIVAMRAVGSGAGLASLGGLLFIVLVLRRLLAESAATR